MVSSEEDMTYLELLINYQLLYLGFIIILMLMAFAVYVVSVVRTRSFFSKTSLGVGLLCLIFVFALPERINVSSGALSHGEYLYPFLQALLTAVLFWVAVGRFINRREIDATGNLAARRPL